MTVAAIIQARMGSTRCPGKTLADIGGMPLLERVIARARLARCVDRVVVATTMRLEDDVVSGWCHAHHVSCYHGSTEDVLDRYLGAVRVFRLRDCDVIVRLTADCPFLDPSVIDDCVEKFLRGGADYVSNVLVQYPEGTDCEVFSVAALLKAYHAATGSDREHVTSYIRAHPELFRLRAYDMGYTGPAVHLSVDTPADLERARAIMARVKGTGWRDTLQAMAEAEAGEWPHK